jgi:HSP90 family molecular chaperone
MIARIQIAPEELACWYVFQERGGVPNILAKQCRFFEVPITTEINHAITDDEATKRRVEKATETRSLWWERALKEIRKAKRLFLTYSEIYEPGQPWLPFAPLGEISDLSFSAFWLDEEVGE